MPAKSFCGRSHSILYRRQAYGFSHRMTSQTSVTDLPPFLPGPLLGPKLVQILTQTGPDLDQTGARSGPDLGQIGARSGSDWG